MPLVNFISARIKPAKKKYQRIRYGSVPGALGVETVIGILLAGKKGPRGGKTEIQSYRFDVRKGWTLAKVKKWVKDKGLKTLKIEDVQKGKAAEEKRKATKKRKVVPKKMGESIALVEGCPKGGKKTMKKKKKKKVTKSAFAELMTKHLG